MNTPRPVARLGPAFYSSPPYRLGPVAALPDGWRELAELSDLDGCYPSRAFERPRDGLCVAVAEYQLEAGDPLVRRLCVWLPDGRRPSADDEAAARGIFLDPARPYTSLGGFLTTSELYLHQTIVSGRVPP